MKSETAETIDLISNRALDIGGSSGSEIERCCWMAVHEFRHGVLPSEYDIREIEEDLYLSVLAITREKTSLL